MKVGVLGAGAMGSYVGALLALAGHQVTLVDVDVDRMRTVQRDGLTLVQPWSTRVADVRAATAPNLLEGSELVLVVTKASSLEAALRSAVPHLGSAAKVAVLCNGLGCREVASQWVVPDQLFYGATAAGAVLDAAAVVRETVTGQTYLGHRQGQRSEELLGLAEALSEAGIATIASDDVDSWIWTKLLINVAFNAVTSLTGALNSALVETEAGRQLVRRLVEEAVSVAAKSGVRLHCTAPVDYVMEVGAKIAAQQSSMLQDLQRGRATEVDYINGAVSSQAHRLGMEVPVNEALVHLVHLREHTLGLCNAAGPPRQLGRATP